MDLLTNLLEFSDHKSSSMLFCLSPKETQQQDKNMKQLKNLMSERKDECITPERKVASKSLSKLDLLTLSSNAKIDPKQRLLHRMVHKLSMKCRKYYYNFFVVLENLKKNNQTLNVPKVKPPPNQNITNGLSKLQQLQQILFSKYFESSLKKSALKSMIKWGRNKVASIKIVKILNNKYISQSFKIISKFSKQREKQEIRMDILLDSINHIDRSINNYHRLIYLQNFMGKLKINLIKSKQISRQKQIQQMKKYQQMVLLQQKKEEEFITPIKPISYDSVKMSHQTSPFSKEKANLSASNQQIKKLKEESPGKLKQPIIVACQQVKLKIQKCYNYIKNSRIKTNLQEKTLPHKFSNQPQYQISKRCQPIALQINQVPDINDKSTLFFNQIFTSERPKAPQNSHFQISESAVHIFNNNELLDEHKRSQASLISPLIQNLYGDSKGKDEESHRSIASSGVKCSAFGSEAVSFKNSLVLQRQSIKNERIEEKAKDKKQFNFAKIKNQAKVEKKAHDQFVRESESKQRADSRYESADKDYTSLKHRRESDFTLSIPDGMISMSAHPSSRVAFTKRTSDTPQPQLIRNNYTSERKHLSLVNSNKISIVREQTKKGSTYLNILSKR